MFVHTTKFTNHPHLFHQSAKGVGRVKRIQTKWFSKTTIFTENLTKKLREGKSISEHLHQETFIHISFNVTHKGY